MQKLFRKLKAWFRQTSLFTRINITIVCITTAALVLMAFLLVRVTVEPSIEKDRALSKVCYEALGNAVRAKYSLIYNQSNLLLSGNHIAPRLATARWNNVSALSFEDTVFFTDYIDSLFFSDRDISDVVIVSADGRHCFARSSASTSRMDPRYDYLSLPSVAAQTAAERNIGAYFDDTQPYARSMDEPVITFVSKILNPMIMSKRDLVGYLIVNYPVSVFKDSVKQYGTLSGISLYVVNADNTVIYANDEGALNTQYDAANERDSEISASPVGITGIRVVGVIPRDMIRTATSKLVVTMLFVIVPCVLLMLLTVLLLNHGYQRRVHDLADVMESVSAEGLGLRIQVDHSDELGRLSEQFNKMCDSLDTYIDLHYRAEIGRQTAELNALQAQINPHFLFNTIESIRMRALEDGAPDVSDMLLQMGNLFRWMILMEKQIVYLEDEIDYVESYLSLQRMRYDDSFASDVEVPDNALYLGVPKFTLQPIVENALLHGLKENGIPGRIRIRVALEEGTLHLFVSDNGSGIPPDMLTQLQRHIRRENTAGGAGERFGIGMQNVDARIRLLFSDGYGVAITSEVGNGTCVEVTLPAMPKKEMEQYVSNRTH